MAKKEGEEVIFKAIVITYCLVGLTYNLLLLPKRNKEIYEENKIIIERYKRLDRLIDKIEQKLEDKNNAQ